MASSFAEACKLTPKLSGPEDLDGWLFAYPAAMKAAAKKIGGDQDASKECVNFIYAVVEPKILALLDANDCFTEGVTWEQLKVSIKRTLIPSAALGVTAARELLIARRQAVGESVHAFANTLAVLIRAIPSEPPAKLDDWAGQMRQSLLPELRKAMYTVKLTTWKDTVEEAASIELLMSLDKASIGAKATATAMVAEQEPARVVGAVQSYGRERQRRFSGSCYYCGRPGHRQADCRDKKAGKPSSKGKMNGFVGREYNCVGRFRCRAFLHFSRSR